jgi:hypothetical protein
MILAAVLRLTRISHVPLRLRSRTHRAVSLRSLGRWGQGNCATRPGDCHVSRWGAYTAQASTPLSFGELVVTGQQHELAASIWQISGDRDWRAVYAAWWGSVAIVGNTRPDAGGREVHPTSGATGHRAPHTHGGVRVIFRPPDKSAINKSTPCTERGHR